MFSKLELDALREIINIGGSHAATSLAELTGQRIEMNIPDIKILTYQQIFDDYIDANVEVYTIYNQIEHDLDGAFLLVVSHETSKLLVQLMLGRKPDNQELAESALSELGNIIANSFLKAMGEMMGLQIQARLPIVVDDIFGAVLTSTYMALEQYDEQILVIRNEFKYAKQNLDASLFFIPKSGNLEKIFDTLEI